MNKRYRGFSVKYFGSVGSRVRITDLRKGTKVILDYPLEYSHAEDFAADYLKGKGISIDAEMLIQLKAGGENETVLLSENFTINLK